MCNFICTGRTLCGDYPQTCITWVTTRTYLNGLSSISEGVTRNIGTPPTSRISLVYQISVAGLRMLLSPHTHKYHLQQPFPLTCLSHKTIHIMQRISVCTCILTDKANTTHLGNSLWLIKPMGQMLLSLQKLYVDSSTTHSVSCTDTA